MNFLSTLEADVSKLAPMALTVIGSVENTMRNSASATKRAAAVEVITNLAKAGEASGNVNIVAIGQLVDVIVSVLNATGLFGHAAPPVATPVQ